MVLFRRQMPHFRRSDVFCLCILTLMMAAMVVGAARAAEQTQDFYNGTFATGLKDVSDRVSRIEGRLDYMLSGLLVILITQVVQIATHVRSRK